MCGKLNTVTSCTSHKNEGLIFTKKGSAVIMADEKIVIPGMDEIEAPDVLKQKDPGKWMKRPPKVFRGDMRVAMKCGMEADKMTCNCWNRKCPFFGDCRKCIAFHNALKQFPTCQRENIIELLKDGELQKEMYMELEVE